MDETYEYPTGSYTRIRPTFNQLELEIKRKNTPEAIRIAQICDASERTALAIELALQTNQPGVVKVIIRHDCAKIADSLNIAITHGQKDIVREMISLQWPIDKETLILAFKYTNDELIELLLEQPNCVITVEALNLAIKDNKSAIAIKIIDKKCITLTSELLEEVIWQGLMDVANVLIAAKCPISENCLRNAIANNHDDLAIILLKLMIVLPDDCIFLTINNGNAKLLDAALAHPNIQLNECNLGHAVEYGQRDTVRKLIAKGCPMKTRTLERVIGHRWPDIATLMLEARCKVSVGAMTTAMLQGYFDLFADVPGEQFPEECLRFAIENNYETFANRIVRGCELSPKCMQLALARQWTSIVHVMLDRKCKLFDGALGMTIDNNFMGIARRLVENGCIMHSRNLERVLGRVYAELVREMIAAGCEVSARAETIARERRIDLLRPHLRQGIAMPIAASQFINIDFDFDDLHGVSYVDGVVENQSDDNLDLSDIFVT